MAIGFFPWFQLVLMIPAFFALSRGADLVVASGSQVARAFGVKDLVIGLTLVAMGTSGPEFAVSLLAAYRGQPQLALGNVVGSNIFNLGLILSVATFGGTLALERGVLTRDLPVLIVSCGLLVVFCLTDAELSRPEAALLIVFLVGYLVLLGITSRRNEEAPATRSAPGDSPSPPPPPPPPALRSLAGIALGLTLLLVGAQVLVGAAAALARGFGISEWLIATTVVAAGTSLPELVTTVASLRRGRADLGLGNLIGSDILNTLGVVGGAAMTRPLALSEVSPWPLVAMAGSVIVLWTLAIPGQRLTRQHGVVIGVLALMRWGYEIIKEF